MIDGPVFNLMPVSIKTQMSAIRAVGLYAVGFAVILFLVMSLFGFFHDIVTAIVFLLVLLFITVPLLFPGFKFDKISQSKICFLPDNISILDKKGKCWRTIDYRIINDVRIEDISGFFYGNNKDMYQDKYICIFLNGLNDIPPVPFARLFTEDNFIMFAYQPEILQLIQQKYRA